MNQIKVILATLIFAFVEIKGQTGEKQNSQSFGEYLQEILENFRGQMKNGIPEIGIPPVDPLVLPDIDENVNEEIAKLTLRMKDITIEGLSQFHVNAINTDLAKGHIKVSFDLPRMHTSGYCYMHGKILNTSPVNNKGNFSIDVKDVQILGEGLLHAYDIMDKEGNKKVKIRFSDFYFDINFGSLAINFDDVLINNEQWKDTIVKVLTGIGQKFFNQFRQEAMKKFDKILLNLFNNKLDKDTIEEILGKNL